LATFGCKTVNYDEMDGDKLWLPANRNCYRLSRVSWALLKLLVWLSVKHWRLPCSSVPGYRQSWFCLQSVGNIIIGEYNAKCKRNMHLQILYKKIYIGRW